MKTLLICRHAKSDWSNLYVKDYDRELNERGERDAPMMGKRLLTRNFNIDLIVSSSAKRAAQTAKLIAQEINYPSKHIHWQDKLYHAPPSVIQEVIFETSNSINTLMIVCHNPGITDFINAQCGIITTNVPTCGMAAFRYDTPSWEQYPTSPCELFFYDFPKNGF
jgi:phosphohistidine phosphatase